MADRATIPPKGITVTRGYWVWVAAGGGALGAWAATGAASMTAWGTTTGVFVVLAVLLGVPAARRRVVTAWLMPMIARALPRMSATERIALEAGTVWWDGELFSGKPDWTKLLEFRPRPLSAEERAFLEGPVEQTVRDGGRLGGTTNRPVEQPQRIGWLGCTPGRGRCQSPTRLGNTRD